MRIVAHRVNTLMQLKDLDPNFGAEIDIRSDPCGKLYIQHDPFAEGVRFEAWLEVFCKRQIQGPLILNTKEDGLESRLMEICEASRIGNYFFLDTTVPTLVKFALKHGESRFACRISAYESSESLNCFRGRVQWVWVDCFDGVPISESIVAALKADFKLCLVSPELHGITSVHPEFFRLLKYCDAVCTKRPELWLSAEISAINK